MAKCKKCNCSYKLPQNKQGGKIVTSFCEPCIHSLLSPKTLNRMKKERKERLRNEK